MQNYQGNKKIPKDNVCAICLDIISKNSSDQVRLKACKHIFHQECIDKVIGKLCPLCRAPMEYGQEPENHNIQAISEGIFNDLEWLEDLITFQLSTKKFKELEITLTLLMGIIQVNPVQL